MRLELSVICCRDLMGRWDLTACYCRSSLSSSTSNVRFTSLTPTWDSNAENIQAFRWVPNGGAGRWASISQRIR